MELRGIHLESMVGDQREMGSCFIGIQDVKLDAFRYLNMLDVPSVVEPYENAALCQGIDGRWVEIAIRQ